ncbi:1-(5-phosphoribosyl)-5-[(5-phosphoribosylamino)methylideneamino] imidazole-4-carboxamide isomerase [Achromatium sp. WMS1]|nr:1-(5-phosphoribosyl)-5-[(5-phosphoribosylamino)methylideneamino] imidazole-4-carboxamide isomerase [Achromatium sp. WMS1]
MLLIPAIDLKDGQCVRLRQGRMEDVTLFSNDPLAMAQRWIQAGARRLHLVDLDGASAGKPVNIEPIRAISSTYPNLPIQVGGGIRNQDTIAAYLDAGVKYCIIGTQAVNKPQFAIQMCQAFPDRIIVGLDAKDGFIAVDGWTTITNYQVIDFAQQFAQVGVSAIIYTDIGRDGMLTGPNIEATKNLADAVAVPIIASGGVTNLDDVRALTKLNHPRLIGTITGRAIYEGTLDFAEGQRIADQA